ncbi:hypothetical protein ACN082_09740 [Rothia sp. CCM 9417]|uniref:hypothetical protein n=1 Tax=Rothia sp. CCM 9417 TaxID=3402657 RepID=UPI003AE4748A
MTTHRTHETVAWKNRSFRVNNLTWGQEFSAGLPDVVAATSGNSTWRGSCEIVRDYDVYQGGANPWSDAYPQPGDRIVIRVYVDGEEVAAHRPVVDAISFDPERARIDFMMPTDTFSAVLRLPPVLQTSPATRLENQWGDETSRTRYPAPTPLWTVAEAFRAARYHLTPPVHASTVIDLSMQGCVWTNTWKKYGETVQCHGLPDSPVAFPRIYGGAGILWMHHGVVYVIPNRGTDMSDGFRLSFMVHLNHHALAEFMVMAWPKRLFLTVNADRSITLVQGTEREHVLTVPADAWADSMMVTLVVHNGQATLYAGQNSMSASTYLDTAFSGVRVIAHEFAGIAGVQVDSLAYGTSARVQGFTSTARIKGGLFTSYMRVCLPSVRDEPARKVLDEICSATLASWWVDGDGVANFEDANSLTEARPAHTIESADIGTYQISSDLQNAGSGVSITYSEPSRSASNRHSITLWAKGGTATAGTTTEDFAKPEDNVEWIEPDFTFNRIASSIAGFNSRNGSWWGAAKNGASHDDPTLWASGYKFKARMVTPWVVKISEEFTEDASRSVYESPEIWRSLRGADTPILRGRGLVERQDNTLSLEGGRPYAPVVEVDARKWVDREDRAQEIAAYLMRFLADPPPILRSVTVAYEPTIKLGQAVKISGYAPDGSDFLFGAVLTCTVTGFEHEPDAGQSTLSLRVIRVEASVKTWRELEAAAALAGVTWAQAEKSITDRGVTWSLFGNSDEDYGG